MLQSDIYKALTEGAEERGRSSASLLTGPCGVIDWPNVLLSPSHTSFMEEILEAEKTMPESIPALPYSVFRLFEEEGNRKEFENLYFAQRKRLCVYALLVLANDEPRYLQELENILWAICDEFTWSLPAHLNYTGDGEQVRNHRHTIDLFAAETAFYLSEVAVLLDDRLSGNVAARIRHEVEDRVLKVYQAGAPFHWEYGSASSTNWAAVCAGSVGAAALYTMKDSARLGVLLHRVLGTMEGFLAGYPEDGSCSEGIGYWNYGFGFYVIFAELLKNRTGGRIDLMQDPKVRRIALFQQKCYLSDGHVLNFSDSSPEYSFNRGLAHKLSELFPEVEVPSDSSAIGFHSDHCYRWAPLIRHMVWSRIDVQGGLPRNAQYYLPDAQVFVTRYHEDGRSAGFAAKGGHNGEFHNHNDVGHFILHVNGRNLLADAGAGEYTKDYFGAGRYGYIGNGSQGHSVPIIGGRLQQEGEGHRAVVLKAEQTTEQDEFMLELAGAYEVPELSSFIRRFLLNKEGGFRLQLEDCYRFTKEGIGVTERLVTFIRPELVEAGFIRIGDGEAGVHLRYDPEQLEASFAVEVFMGHDAKPQDLYIIDLKAQRLGLEGNILMILEMV